MLTFLIICSIIGLIAGFLAGLFGIGGGLIVVPTLVYLLPLVNVPPEKVMPIALGTSFSTIIFTAFSSAARHHKLGNVDWQVSKLFVPSLILSVFITGLVIGKLPTAFTNKVFAILVVYLALKMILSLQKKSEIRPLTARSTIIAGGIIGTLSSFAGIGGGAFIVPFLNNRGIEMKRAIGTASLCGALLALGGTLSFITSGWNVPNLPEYTVGYVYLPALFAVTLTSVFTSKLGANAANVLPVATLKKAFAVFLLVTAINMLFK